ncbi:MAG: hypothetical protein RR400_02300, partial [Clostridia bacterium]
MWKVINFKEIVYAAQDTQKYFEIELEKAKQENLLGFKIIHGYGSHGTGGLICNELRQCLEWFKKRKEISDYIVGTSWNFANEKCLKFLSRCKDAAS